MTQAPGAAPGPALTVEQAEALAKKHGLKTLGERPPFFTYVRELIRRRAFIWTLSRAQSTGKHQANQLGWLWSIFNPVLMIISYYVIFGLILRTNMGNGGPGQRIAFLSIGVILFTVSATVVSTGAKSIVSNNGLMRALHFPRAVLPLSVALTEFLANLPAFAVLIGVMFLIGERPQVAWLLFPVAITFQMLILTGVALICARIVNMSRDLANFIPVALRVLRYISGVFFSLSHYAPNNSVASAIMNYQPFALPLTTAREALLVDHAIVPMHWVVMAAWGVGLFWVGLWFFWRDEAKYGRG
ncbi:ABC transporter permease [Janibacter sp. GXQ6167]|uniref:ABC transporter permease n=1 Tax=Janibacter sp. GXQ6167 TaxID=3240791 RepID=UPI003524066B